MSDIHSRKQVYASLCAAEASIPLFMQPWWLDAVCDGAEWDVALVERGGRIDGALPYVLRKRFGFTVLTQPKLTRALGPWLRPSEAKSPRALSHEKDVLGALADGLPRFDWYRQAWAPERGNWLPFYWRGFRQTTRYTYVLDDISDAAAIWAGLNENIRREIRKARARFGLKVVASDDARGLTDIVGKTYRRQRRNPPFPAPFLDSLVRVAAERGVGKVYQAVAADGRVHAAAWVVRDLHTAYYLIGGGDPEIRNSGAGSLCLWEAIQGSAAEVRRFDFEGSMHEPIERFFREFGGRQQAFFQVSKSATRLHDVAALLAGR